jgi:hypothetical protein
MTKAASSDVKRDLCVYLLDGVYCGGIALDAGVDVYIF